MQQRTQDFCSGVTQCYDGIGLRCSEVENLLINRENKGVIYVAVCTLTLKVHTCKFRILLHIYNARPPTEVATWRGFNNPVIRFRRYLQMRGLWDEGKEKELLDAIQKEIIRIISVR